MAFSIFYVFKFHAILLLHYFPLCLILAVSSSLQPTKSVPARRNSASVALPLFSRPVSASPSTLLNSLAANAIRRRSNYSASSVSLSTAQLYFHYNVSLAVPIMLGTPPQEVLMEIDTGSELSWVQCKSCNGCSVGTQPSIFNPFVSTSYTEIPCTSLICTEETKDLPSPIYCDDRQLCHFTCNYADGSSGEGNMGQENVTLGKNSTIQGLVFGCVNSSFSGNNSGDPQLTTGLMGLNRGALSFVQQLGSNYPKKFSYCISDSVNFSASSGVLIFGDPSMYSNSSMQYTPLVNLSQSLPDFNKVAYSVSLKGIKVGAKLLPLPQSVFMPDNTGAGQTMVDSGTQFTFLMGPVYKALKEEFMLQIQGRLPVIKNGDFRFQGVLDLCYSLPQMAAFPLLPPVTLVLDSVEVKVEGNQLLYRIPEENINGSDNETEAVYCFTFGNSDLIPIEASIIGNYHQQNLWIEYDLENSRIGFAPANCSMY